MAAITFDSQHEDLLHDAQLDYYGRKLATCSSDRTIRLFEIEGDQHRPIDVLRGHEGPVWQVAWAHPKFGNVLASCSYDSRVLVWMEMNGQWTRIKEHVGHTASVNSVSWAPHEFGLSLACASSDGKISVLTCKEDGQWESIVFPAHSIGCNAVSWAPATIPGSLVHTTPSTGTNQPIRRFASAGSDNMIKIWKDDGAGSWKEEHTLEGHSDWVRDVAWAPNIGLPHSYLASCGQDKLVFVWTQDHAAANWTRKLVKNEPFPDVVWRVSWSMAGNILAISSGDNKVSLWKENLKGDYSQIGEDSGI
ncbi:hypothetical protein SeMB42_g00087 [Synchytrium endobioticum]|uniref:Uncharacterized protein n=1 Tax=Synchytrium endobioticum TaxID=286115 RepID=A0A507DUC3_9FUNG|nr:hypothetical protein SeLEV6574_g00183 [Synchytrium endobioticum]TPX54882.1 hypothetical protein SeMB42_g00087 [Synchytrium endobioticum]